MNSNIERSPSWVFADGSASVSASALFAVLISLSPSLAGLWGLGFLHELTTREEGIIVVATLLLFPSTIIIYGVARMIFAAKEAVERKAMEKGLEKGLEEGLEKGRQEERERIEREIQTLEKSGVQVPPEVASIIARQSAPKS